MERKKVITLVLLRAFSFALCPLLGTYNFLLSVTYISRCMTTRRDNPGGSLWRLAVEGLNRVVLDDVSKVTIDSQEDQTIQRPARVRVWKEVADVYESFLAGHCGRALSYSALSATVLKADELLEMNILDILGDKILKSQIDVPLDVISLPTCSITSMISLILEEKSQFT